MYGTAMAELAGRVVKVDRERRNVYGWAYVAKRADGSQVVDHSGDEVDNDEAVEALHKAFDAYALDHRTGDVDHTTFGVSKLVEYVWMDGEKAQAMGIPDDVPEGAWIGVHFPPDGGGPSDQAWAGVKNRRKLAFSIVGAGRRQGD